MKALIGLLAATCLCLAVALGCVVGLYWQQQRAAARVQILEGATRQYILAASQYSAQAVRAEWRLNLLAHQCAP